MGIRRDATHTRETVERMGECASSVEMAVVKNAAKIGDAAETITMIVCIVGVLSAAYLAYRLISA